MLDPSETDVTRGARQQDVMNAASRRNSHRSGLARMPFFGDSFAKPLTTDLTASRSSCSSAG